MEHFILDWPTEVHNYNTIFDRPYLCEAILDDILHTNVQHFVTFDRNIAEK